MNSSITRFSLDLHSAQSQISIPVLLGDTSRAFHISLSDGGRPYTIEDGCLAKLSIRRPTGTHLEEFCTIENNTTIVYSFDQNENTAAVEGIHDCDITLYGLDGKSIGSPKFSIVVDERVIRRDDINVTDDDKTVIDAMIQAEASRQYAESGRVIAETLRVEAEKSRSTAEEQRVSAEAERIAAEDERLKIGQIASESAERAKLSETSAKNSENAARAAVELAREFGGDAKKLEPRISRNDKRITNLEKGIPAELFVTESSVAHSKVVPTNALPYAEITKIGGMTYRDRATQTLRCAKVTDILGVGSFPIPEAVQALDGYGDGINEDCYNYIDYEKKQFIRRVGKVDMGTLDWVVDDPNNMLRAEVSGLQGNILCASYETVSDAFDEGICAGDEQVSIYPANGTNVDTLSGEILYYELAVPEVIDISDFISEDNFIAVEGGSTITAVNENSFAVPSEITYMLKEDAV